MERSASSKHFEANLKHSQSRLHSRQTMPIASNIPRKSAAKNWVVDRKWARRRCNVLTSPRTERDWAGTEVAAINFHLAVVVRQAIDITVESLGRTRLSLQLKGRRD